MRKLLTLLAVIGGVTLTLPATASAHHPVVVSSDYTCVQDGSWLITWTASPDAVRGYTWWLTAPVNTSSTPKPDSQSIQFTTTAPGSATSASVSVSAAWSNGATGTRTGSVVFEEETCTTTTSTTTSTTSTTSTTTTTLPVTTTTVTIPPGCEFFGNCPTTTPAPTTTTPDPTTTQPESTTTEDTTTTVVVIDDCQQLGNCPTTTPGPTVPPSTHPPTGSASSTFAAGTGAILLALGGGLLGLTKLARR